MTGLNFLSIQNFSKQSPTFFKSFPMFIASSSQISSHASGSQKLKSICRCLSGCNDSPKAIWPHNTKEIIQILSNALSLHIQSAPYPHFQETIVSQFDYSTTVKAGDVLPFIPNATIHFRCGDNFQGEYGFLPLSTYREVIPADIQYLYILSEGRKRYDASKKTKDLDFFTERKLVLCDRIAKLLVNYLHRYFKNATILVRRNDDLFADFARLAYSNTTVCSVSTFCLWPAIAHQGTVAYFPRTRVVLGGKMPDLGPKFIWLKEPRIIKGATFYDKILAQIEALDRPPSNYTTVMFFPPSYNNSQEVRINVARHGHGFPSLPSPPLSLLSLSPSSKRSFIFNSLEMITSFLLLLLFFVITAYWKLSSTWINRQHYRQY
jgi:hypothetical protein